MPSKSRHSRGKHSFQSKKRKGKRTPALTTTEQQVATQIYKPAAPSKVVVPSASVLTPVPTPTVAKYPYVVGEVRRIGILAGIMVAVLIILSFVLP